jgi:nucleotide-binding universal stress UspA family protein
MIMKTTVVGYDRTPPSELALAEAAREAVQRGTSLSVVTAYHWPSPSAPASAPEPGSAEQAAAKAAEQTAQDGADRALARNPGLSVEALAVAGYAGKVLAETSHTADLLVVGHRGGGGFTGMQLGSTALRVLAGACCPVLVVRDTGHAPHNRVIAAVDIDEPCDAILDFAFAEASRRSAGLTAIHVWDEPWILAYGQEDPGIADDIAGIEAERESRLEAVVRGAHGRYPETHPFHQIATGSTAAILVEAAKHADLLVTGARRHGDGAHGMIIGPVTQTVLHHAECPVAVVPIG